MLFLQRLLVEGKGLMSTPLECSQNMHTLFTNQVYSKVLPNKTEDKDGDVYYGCPHKTILSLLNDGRGDFKKGHNVPGGGKITGEQLVLMYCHYIMKGHLFVAMHGFRRSKALLDGMLAGASNVAMVDFGCGPGTSGLAFAEVCPKVPFTYIGVDHAKPMLDQAKSMLNEGKKQGIIAGKTEVLTQVNWSSIPTKFRRGSLIILSFSYFFASPFLTVECIDALVDLYLAVIRDNPGSRVAIFYTNSTNPAACKWYKEFIRRLDLIYDSDPPHEGRIEYYSSRDATRKKLADIAFEMFEIID
jgi:hypothetical protein